MLLPKVICLYEAICYLILTKFNLDDFDFSTLLFLYSKIQYEKKRNQNIQVYELPKAILFQVVTKIQADWKNSSKDN